MKRLEEKIEGIESGLLMEPISEPCDYETSTGLKLENVKATEAIPMVSTSCVYYFAIFTTRTQSISYKMFLMET